MRAYCYWAIRDALDPQCNSNLALPPIDELTQDLTEPRWSFRSDGKILLEEKSEIKKRLGRSPDYGDALALTYYPKSIMSEWSKYPLCDIVWRPSPLESATPFFGGIIQQKVITDNGRFITSTLVPLHNWR